MVKIGVLTSSRADFGVYLPLLKGFLREPDINFEIIAFGSHLSNLHGYTLNEIKDNGFIVNHEISCMIADDTEVAIATTAALTSLKFAEFWSNHKTDFDLILCLGDRYEMFSAVIAGIPFGVKFVHLYGGDFSKGVIDNVYRDGMTHASIMHFTSNQKCADRVLAMTGAMDSIDVIGILSLDDLENIKLLSDKEFKSRWNIDLSIPTILISFHPETVDSEKNSQYAKILRNTFNELCKKYQLVITMPNADTNGSVYRTVFELLKEENQKSVFLIENLGIQSYLSCMKHSLLLIGNTSSGISEAATFNKYFINVGVRQIGRELGKNIFNVPFDKRLILEKIQEVIDLGNYAGENIYKIEGAVNLIISRLKSFTN
ncbi:MAG: UDP-N-acetylglucosamine 2-epimerase [Tenuifilaceae bacterium]